MNISQSDYQGVLRFDEPMSRHTSWRAGGAAKLFFAPESKSELVSFLRGLSGDEEILWIGLGSNMLIRDGGFDGAVIATYRALKDIETTGPQTVYAGAGVPSAIVARFCADQGLGGLEFLAGIPGTFGGGLRMNAGAHGSEIWEYVKRAETIDSDGMVRQRIPADFQISYRSVRGAEGEWFLGAELQLQERSVAESKNMIREFLEVRERMQPTRLPNCGSVFKNPEGDFAGRLIQESGLMGVCVGGACVSTKHANFIVNTGSATASDIESLIELVRMRVEKRFGVNLETEVQIFGEKSNDSTH